MAFYKKNIIEAMCATPLVALSRINKVMGTNVIVKLEKNNPGGSVKDRVAHFIIEYAEKEGLLKPGGTIIESSSGNFGISLAMIGAVKGYKVIIFVDPRTTETNQALMRAFGAEVIMVTEKDDTGLYNKNRIRMANKLAKIIPGSYRPDQSFNVLNSMAHYYTTAQEIHQQTEGEILGVACAVSTGGQIGGLTKYFRHYLPDTKMICVDAYGSAVSGGPTHYYRMPGVGQGWTSRNIKDISDIDLFYKSKDEAAHMAARLLCRHEGILVGVSSGAVLLAALNASLRFGNSKPVIAVMADSGERYVDTLFNHEWLTENRMNTGVELELLQKLTETMAEPVKGCDLIKNYRDDLIETLEIPTTTITHHSQLSELKLC